MNLKVYIIDDEEISRTGLKTMLTDFCQNISIVGEAGTIQKAVNAIPALNPDVIFLDIIMPKENGFELFKYFPSPKFDVIFSTAYNEYAIKAFQLAAIDYLLKPIDLHLLRNALERVKIRKSPTVDDERFSILKKSLNSDLEKICLSTNDGYHFMKIKNIIRCEAQGNYTLFYFIDGKKLLVSKTLKWYEKVLSEFNFFRINRSNLINLKFVSKVGRQRNPIVLLDNDTELIISSFRKNDFFEKVGKGI